MSRAHGVGIDEPLGVKGCANVWRVVTRWTDLETGEERVMMREVYDALTCFEALASGLASNGRDKEAVRLVRGKERKGCTFQVVSVTLAE